MLSSLQVLVLWIVDYKFSSLTRQTAIWKQTYRFAVVDYSRSKSYPANFVCMLPAKVDQGKGKIANVFGTLLEIEA